LRQPPLAQLRHNRTDLIPKPGFGGDHSSRGLIEQDHQGSMIGIRADDPIADALE
jgi:hypothetical protein